MFGLFNEHDYLNDRIEALDSKLTEEQLERHRLQASINELLSDIKDVFSVLRCELDDKYFKDPAGTLKYIYDKYKYTKFNDTPIHIKSFLREQKLTTVLTPENRTIGKILDGSIVDVNGRPVVINCVGCTKLEAEREEDCKCSKKKGKKK